MVSVCVCKGNSWGVFEGSTIAEKLRLTLRSGKLSEQDGSWWRKGGDNEQVQREMEPS